MEDVPQIMMSPHTRYDVDSAVTIDVPQRDGVGIPGNGGLPYRAVAKGTAEVFVDRIGFVTEVAADEIEVAVAIHVTQRDRVCVA